MAVLSRAIYEMPRDISITWQSRSCFSCFLLSFISSSFQLILPSKKLDKQEMFSVDTCTATASAILSLITVVLRFIGRVGVGLVTVT